MAHIVVVDGLDRLVQFMGLRMVLPCWRACKRGWGGGMDVIWALGAARSIKSI